MKESTIKKQNKNLSQIKLQRQIASYFNQNLSPDQIFEKIKTHHNIETLSQFLYNSGSYKELLKLSISLLKNHKKVSWTFVLPVLTKADIKINPSESKVLFHNWLKDYSTKHPSVFACKKWEIYSQEFSNLLNNHLENLKEKHTSEDAKLLETLDFLRVQDLIHEESKIIKSLLAREPTNKKYQELEKSLKERKALKVIENQKVALYKARISDKAKSHFTPENTDIKSRWSKIIQNIALKEPKQIKNLSLFLYFLNWPDESIFILKTNLKKTSDYWFYLEWLMETGQYTKSLDLTNQLLEKLQDPEALFPLIYIKAQIFYYLGKKDKAIEHLKSILQIRPDYKSAQSLLEKWTKK